MDRHLVAYSHLTPSTMKQIDFVVAGKRYEYTVPEKWSEVTADQFRAYVELGTFSVELVRRIMAMDDVVAVSLTPADWWCIRQEFQWLRETEGIGKLFIDHVTTKDGTVCYGYNADFSDVTWEEWMFADSYASADRWDVVAAVLYRPEREAWNHETDRRRPFSKVGAESRVAQMKDVDPLTIQCIKVNYLMLRKRLTDHFYHLFLDASNEEDGRQRQQGRTDWLTIIRNMMGDNFYEEQKYYQRSVPSVFFQLERRVKEARKHGNG